MLASEGVATLKRLPKQAFSPSQHSIDSKPRGNTYCCLTPGTHGLTIQLFNNSTEEIGTLVGWVWFVPGAGHK